MPQLHHRDPSIIGLLGASPHLSIPSSTSLIASFPPSPSRSHAISRSASLKRHAAHDSQGPQLTSEAFDDLETPPQTPVLKATPVTEELHLEKGKIATMDFERPFYELIVDGIHSHPNSVRVWRHPVRSSVSHFSDISRIQLAYSSYPEGCILITDGKSRVIHQPASSLIIALFLQR